MYDFSFALYKFYLYFINLHLYSIMIIHLYCIRVFIYVCYDEFHWFNSYYARKGKRARCSKWRWSLKVVVRVRVRVGEKPSWEFKLLTNSLLVHGFSPNLEVFILVWVEVCHKLWILLNCQNIGLICDNRVPGLLKVVVGKAELRAESGF